MYMGTNRDGMIQQGLKYSPNSQVFVEQERWSVLLVLLMGFVNVLIYRWNVLPEADAQRICVSQKSVLQEAGVHVCGPTPDIPLSV